MSSKTELFVRKGKAGVYTVAKEDSTTGNMFWVDSGSASGANGALYGKSPATPFVTIDYAVGKCTDNNGDIIWVMPGHAESLTAATSLAIDVAGVKIVGLGWGYSIPKLTYATDPAATIAITAPNCDLQNLWLFNGYTGGITAGITASALADGLVLKNLIMEETTATEEFLIGISLAAACHHVTIDNLQYYGVIGGHAANAVKFVGASNFSTVKNSWIYGDFSGAAVDALTAASTYMSIHHNHVYNIDGAAGLTISVKSDTTGVMAYNNTFSATSNVCPVGAAMAFIENKTTNVAGAQGFLLPAVDS